MDINKIAMCGSLESNDLMVTVRPGDGQIRIAIDSIVKVQYGDRIDAVVRETLEEMNVSSADVSIQDRGALDCTIRARVETALLRTQAGGETI